MPINKTSTYLAFVALTKQIFPRLFSLFLLVSLPLHEAFSANCLYVSSYHRGYEWNDGIEKGIREGLDGQCNLDILFMDTKRNNSPEFAEKAALKVKIHIEATKPDIVIASDDNASKYLIMPYYRDASLPFVFCGINWTVDEYGYPYSNVTGMVEVAPILPLLKAIQNILPETAQGVYISADNETELKDYERYKKIYSVEGVELTGVFVKTMADWKAAYLKAQSSDFIILNNNSGINDWNNKEAQAFTRNNTLKLTVTNYDWMIPYTMIALTKLPEEQGNWAAQVALAILDGEKPSDIPIVVNRRWNIYTNPSLLGKTTYKLPAYLRQKAIER